ncbi:MAG: hypothetical protein WBL28_09215 [Methylotenera sp.]
MLSNVMHKIQTALHHQEVQKNLGWMDTLTEMDALSALKMTTAQLAKNQFKSADNLKHQIDIVLAIDKKSYQNAKKITYKYLTTLKLNKELEIELYNAAYAYQRQLYVAYTQFLDLYLGQNKTVFTDEEINLILCRHLNATFAMAKWRYFDDQPAPTGTWANVCKVIKCAENLSLLNTNLFLYDHQKKEISIATLLKRGFMMDTLHKGSYSRLQIQLTEQVLRVWATNPLLLNKHKQDKFQFFIDVEADKGPERIRAVEKFADYRFWKTTRLIDKIEAYLCAVDTQKPLHEFGLEKMASTDVLVKLFKKLRVDWCVEGYERQRRKESRNKRNKLINVSYGLEDICRRLNAAKPKLDTKPIQRDAFGFEMQVAAHRRGQAPQVYQTSENKLGSENWWLVDESASGFAVDLGKTYNSWIEPGKLIGYTTPEDKDLFVIAEIRSVRKQANGTYRAGLKVLGSHGTSVQVGRVDQNNFSEALSGYFVDEADANLSQFNTFAGLLLDKQDDSKSNKASLIVPRCEYKRGSKFRINIEGDDRIIEVGVPLMKQREWVRVTLPI